MNQEPYFKAKPSILHQVQSGAFIQKPTQNLKQVKEPVQLSNQQHIPYTSEPFQQKLSPHVPQNTNHIPSYSKQQNARLQSFAYKFSNEIPADKNNYYNNLNSQRPHLIVIDKKKPDTQLKSNQQPIRQNTFQRKIQKDSIQVVPDPSKRYFYQISMKKIIRMQALLRGKRVRNQFFFILKNSRYRMSIFNEMIETEKAYVRDLKTLYKDFIERIKFQNIISDSELQRCFVNIPQIIQLNEQMLMELINNPWHQVIKIILKFAPFFKIYFEYCNNYENMNTMISKFKKNPRFLEVYKEVLTTSFRDQQIESILVKPVQRPPKYVLLLKDYLRHTDIDHVDYQNVQKALELFIKVNDENNKNMDRVITNAKMFELQKLFGNENLKIVDPKRDFLLEEPMSVFWRNLPKPVIVYFLSDMLLITERDVQSNKTNQEMKLLSPFYITKYSFIKDIPDQNNFRYILILIGEPETITFLCQDDQSKFKITQVLEGIIQKLSDIQEKRQEALEKGNISLGAKRNIWKVEVDVLGSEELSSTFSTYTQYVIEVSIESIVSKIFLRYKEFIAMQDQILKLFPSLNLPFQTDKQWIGKSENKVIEARKLQMQIFLSSLLGNPEFYEHQNNRKEKDIQTVLKYIGLPENFYELPLILNQFQNKCEDVDISVMAGSEEKVYQHTHNEQIHSDDDSVIIMGNRNSNTPPKRESLMNIKQGNIINYKNTKSSGNSEIVKIQGQKKSEIQIPKPEDLFNIKDRNSISTASMKEDGKRLGRGMSCNSSANRRVSSTKLLQSTYQKQQQPQQIRHTLLVKLSNQCIEFKITDYSRAIEIVQQVAQRIGLVQYYDFKLVEEKSERLIQDDEILLNIFRDKEQKGKTNFNLFKKVQNILSDNYTILFKKVLFLPRSIELQEYTDDVRLKLIIGQLMNDIIHQTIKLSFKELCTIVALQVFIIQTETNNELLSFDQIQKFVPVAFLKDTRREIWIEQISDQLTFIRKQIETALNQKLQIKVAREHIIQHAQSIKLYGILLFQAQNSLENKFQQKIPPHFLIGVNCEGIHILEHKKIILTFYSNKIEDMKVYTNYFEIKVNETSGETNIFKFISFQSYQIYHIYGEYQQILFDFEQSESENV